MFAVLIFLSELLEGVDLYCQSSLYIGLLRAVYNFKHIFTILFVNFTVSEKYILEDSF